MPVPASIDELSPIAANNYPAGTEKVFPNLDDYLRFHASCIAQLRERIKEESTPLASVSWWGGARSSISPQLLAVDGQSLQRADYPLLWAFVSGGGFPLQTEAAWQASPSSRSSFSSGDGATTFRMPDLNGKQVGSLGAVHLRGDGAKAASASGQIQDSQNLYHNHSASSGQAGAHNHQVNDPGHAHSVAGSAGIGQGSSGTNSVMQIFGSQATSPSGTGIWLSSAGTHDHSIFIGAAGGNEARPITATGVWVMRVK